MKVKVDNEIKKQIHSVMNRFSMKQTLKTVFVAATFVFAGTMALTAQNEKGTSQQVKVGESGAAASSSFDETKVTVKGFVVSPENKPVPNVSISVEGSRDMPAFSDENGQFELIAYASDVWLSVAPANQYKRKRVFLGNRNQLTIMLTPLGVSSGEDELIVLSQTVNRRNMSSSYSDLDVSNINNSIVASVDRYFQGRIAGMHVINQSGTPAAGATTYIRGVNSLNASNQPLIIVDGSIMEPQGMFGSIVNGFNYNPLLSINPLDISNLTILKDADYAATYGSKASNGMIMIQTLDPSATETSFDIDFRTGLSLKPSRYIPQLNAMQHKTLANELIYTSGLLEEEMVEEFPNIFLEPDMETFINYQHDTEWQQYIFDDASFTNFNIKVKGGDEIARYGLSFGYYNNNGILRNTSYDGYNIRFVSLVNIFTWFRMNATVSFNTSNSNLKESAVVRETSPILSSLAKSPLLNPYQYDADDNRTLMLSEVDEFGISNPLATIQNFEANNKNYHINTSIGFEADLGEKLTLSTNVGILYNSLKEKMFMPNKGMELYYDSEAHNVAKAATNTFNGFTNNTMLKYNLEIGNSHVINSTSGFNIMTSKFQYDWGIAKNAHENDEYRMLADGIGNLREMGGDNRNWNWASIYEKVSYAFQDKYLATATVSLDASSRVGRDALNTLKIMGYPFGVFYSTGLGWRISNEPFLDELAWLEELKLRASYGRVGNDDIGEANASNFLRTVHYRSTSGVVPATIPNTILTYETLDKLNAGVDLALWGNRIRINFDLFKTDVSNMLIYIPLQAYIGYDYRPENSAKMENKGWDFYTYLRIVNAHNFKWDIEATMSKASNQILEINNDKFVTTLNSYEIVNQVGEAANSFYGYQFNGVYSTTDEAQNAALVNDKGVPFRAGDAIYEDISGPNGNPDGVINHHDKTVIGNPFPEMIGGITNTFIYRNWTLSAFVNFVSGNEVYNYLRYKNESMTDFANQSSYTLNRWQYEGQKTEVPRALWNDPVGNSDFSTRWIEDGSYLRLKNISLSYRIPREFLAFKYAEFYISATNLITLSNYLGYDPEFSYSFNLLDQGIDYGQTPHPRQFLVGIKIGL
jgi:TonB-linked SusC/RagA family outer membrane protein